MAADTKSVLLSSHLPSFCPSPVKALKAPLDFTKSSSRWSSISKFTCPPRANLRSSAGTSLEARRMCIVIKSIDKELKTTFCCVLTHRRAPLPEQLQNGALPLPMATRETGMQKRLQNMHPDNACFLFMLPRELSPQMLVPSQAIRNLPSCPQESKHPLVIISSAKQDLRRTHLPRV